MIKHRVMIRREKKEVLTELPDKIRTCISIECDKSLAKKIEKKMAKNAEFQDKMDVFGEGDGAGTEQELAIFDKKNKNMLELYALTGRSKMSKIKEYVFDLYESGQKFLVFGHHKDVLDAVQDAVQKKLKTQFIRIDGQTAPHQRQLMVDSFQQNDRIRVAILSITAAGTGLTLTAATTVVFAELYWGPTALLQCEDRAHRISQTSAVNIVYLLGKGSLDDRMWPMISKKMEVISQTMSGKQLTMEVEQYQKQFMIKKQPKRLPLHPVDVQKEEIKKSHKSKTQTRITSMLTPIGKKEK